MAGPRRPGLRGPQCPGGSSWGTGASAPMPRPSPDLEGPAPSSPQSRWQGRCHLWPPMPAGPSCPALALPVGAERSSLPFPGSLPPDPGGSLSLLLTPRPKAQATTSGQWTYSNTPGRASRGCFGGVAGPGPFGGFGVPPSCPSGMLFSAHAAVVSDSCTWAGAGWEFLLGLPWPKVTGEQGRLPAWRRGGDLGRVTKVDSSGGLSERPLGASHCPGAHQDRELKQEHVPS